ncbi:helix-turn-helix domain-containing protein [Clostridium sp. YIM B02515]|uniref:Helix-turn-helix domain-containing protein n=1 Tax=Clostridium rhizosphaerae TaxID=2803861 RepID=A0ABS1TID7_9CLOT|nr:helix-turn-helix domain-containing protein [Clostridium rhizosphaerae]MBL4937718.1 helix-turn-helix domain-containing protein [Clostridium rhizosphaerae]
MRKNRIKNLREMMELTQGQLAEMMGTTQQRISQIENGSVEPSITEVSKLLKIFWCSFDELFVEEELSDENCTSILITYKPLEDHVDPNFNYLIYGESGQKESRIINILDENRNGYKQIYIFFNTTINGSRYITGYFLIDKVLKRSDDDEEINNLPDCSAKFDDSLIIVGNREKSKILTFPLLFDKKLALSLYSLGFQEEEFIDEDKELAHISNKTRMHRLLSDADTRILLSKCEKRG